MIKKAILSTFIFLALHGILVMVRPPHTSGQHQWQDNIIKAQRFIYDENDASYDVIVGSSLSGRLVMDRLPHMYNLSFGGLTIFDGLNILAHKETVPQRIFIEMNVVWKKEDEGFTSSINQPILYYLRKMFPSLRDEYEPIGLLGDRIIPIITNRMTSYMQKKETANDLSVEKEKHNAFFTRMLNIQIESYTQKLDLKALDESFKNLKLYVNELERRNAHVIFYEMPVNQKLCYLPLATSIREKFHEYFPVTKYSYIYAPDCSEYETMDGLHLGNEEAVKYTNYFKSQISQLSIF